LVNSLTRSRLDRPEACLLLFSYEILDPRSREFYVRSKRQLPRDFLLAFMLL